MRFNAVFQKIPLVSLMVALLALIACSSASAESVKYFDTTIRVQKDSTVYVTESLIYDFENNQRYGISRNIPTTFHRGDTTYTTDFRLLGATEGPDDRPIKTKLVKRDDGAIVTIGDHRVPFSGRHIFKLHYMLRNGVDFKNGVPQLNFSAVGSEWPVSIEHLKVIVFPPDGVSPTRIERQASVSGDAARSEKVEMTSDNSFVEYSIAPLDAGEDLLITAGFPVGTVQPPSPFQKLLFWLADWWPALVVPSLTACAIWVVWWHYGRDAANPNEIKTGWTPPTDLSPAEVGTLFDERCDMQDIIATIIDLAARGHLRISEAPKINKMGLGTCEYVLTKTEAPSDDPALRKYEKNFLSGIFEHTDEVYLSNLKQTFYNKIPVIRDEIYDALAQEGYFLQNPETVRKQYTSLALFFCLMGMVLILASSTSAVLAPFGIGVVASAAIIGAFSSAMPARTEKGIVALRRSIGFANFVETAEPRSVQLLVAEDPTIFGRLLPYTMVLGAADKWAETFLGAIDSPPAWYSPLGANDSDYQFSSTKFVADLGASMRTMEATLTSEPPGVSAASIGAD